MTSTTKTYSNPLASLIGHNAALLAAIGPVLKTLVDVAPIPAALQQTIVSLGDAAVSLGAKNDSAAATVQSVADAPPAPGSVTGVPAALPVALTVGTVEHDALSAALNFAASEVNAFLAGSTNVLVEDIAPVVRSLEPAAEAFVQSEVFRQPGANVVQPIAADPTKN